jgi:flagellar motor switch protein FliG
MKSTPESIRKAALLIASLDQDTADNLIERMPAEQAAMVRSVLADLEHIDANEQEAAIDEFMGSAPRSAARGTSSGASDPHSRVAHRKFSPVRIDPPAAGNAPHMARFRFLEHTAGEQLGPLLESEHPQTIALVVSHLPPAQAMAAISGLSPPVQADVIRRLSDIGQAHPEVLEDVELALESRLGEHVRGEQRRAAGIATVSQILDAADPSVASAIVANVSRHNPRLGGQLEQQPIDFHDLMYLDGPGLALLFKEAGQELTTLALTGSDPGITARALRIFSAELAAQLSHDLENPGPTRLSDVEDARQEIIAIARRLAGQRRLKLNRRPTGLLA